MHTSYWSIEINTQEQPLREGESISRASDKLSSVTTGTLTKVLTKFHDNGIQGECVWIPGDNDSSMKV